MFTLTRHRAPRAWGASTSHTLSAPLRAARGDSTRAADRRRRRRRRLKGSRARGLEGSRARGGSDEAVMPDGSRRQSSGAEAVEARGTRPAEARCPDRGDREGTGARQSRRQRHRQQRACCNRSKAFDECSDRSLPHLLLSSPLLSLSLSNAVIGSCSVINVQLHVMHARRVASTQNAPRHDASRKEHRVGGLSYVRIILSPPAASAA